MKQAVKGALLSGLLYPGLGQLFLGRRLRGLLFILLATLSLVTLVTQATGKALALVERAESEGSALDLVAIAHAAWRTSLAAPLARWAAVALAAGWVLSVVDAFLLGIRHETRRGSGFREGGGAGTGPEFGKGRR